MEDLAIRNAVRLQEAAGLEVVTDGEYRRGNLGRVVRTTFGWNNWGPEYSVWSAFPFRRLPCLQTSGGNETNKDYTKHCFSSGPGLGRHVRDRLDKP